MMCYMQNNTARWRVVTSRLARFCYLASEYHHKKDVIIITICKIKQKKACNFLLIRYYIHMARHPIRYHFTKQRNEEMIKTIKLAGITYPWIINDAILPSGESVMNRRVETDIGIYEYKPARGHARILFYKQKDAWGEFCSEEKEIKNEVDLNNEVTRMYNENRPFYI